jgi:hypothetical protein
MKTWLGLAIMGFMKIAGNRNTKESPAYRTFLDRMLDTFLIEFNRENKLINLNTITIPENLPLFKPAEPYGLVWTQKFNSTPVQKKQLGYLPNIKLVRRKSNYTNGWYIERLVIQASVPKTKYGNSYFGVDQTDRRAAFVKLEKDLNTLGLPITVAQLELAALREIAFCFNFYLPDNLPYPIEFLKKMSFLGIGKRFKGVKNTDFIENEAGYAVKLFNGQVGGGLYDKRTQMFNEAKTESELEIVEKMKRHELPDKILRLEVTYQDQTSVKQHLRTRLGGDRLQIRHLGEVFNNVLAKGILLDTFNEFAKEVNVKGLEMELIPIEAATEKLRAAGFSDYDICAWIGHSYQIQQIGAQVKREIHDRYYPRGYSARLDKRLQKIVDRGLLPKGTLTEVFDECRKQLMAFEVLKPDTVKPPSLPSSATQLSLIGA